MSEKNFKQKPNEVREKETKNWLNLSIELLAVTLTILTLMWTFQTVVIPVSYLLLAAFPIFVNAVTVNSNLIQKTQLGADEKLLKNLERFAEYSYGLGYTLLLCAFAIASYAVMGDNLTGPTLLLVIAWVIMAIYEEINDNAHRFSFLHNKKKCLWLLLEILTLVFIYLDFFQVIDWINTIV